jgi:hypothetical protein
VPATNRCPVLIDSRARAIRAGVPSNQGRDRIVLAFAIHRCWLKVYGRAALAQAEIGVFGTGYDPTHAGCSEKEKKGKMPFTEEEAKTSAVLGVFVSSSPR